MSIAGAATRAAASIAPKLSFPASSGIGRALGSVAWALDGRHRNVAIRNLGLAFPGMPHSRRQRLALRSFQQAGRTAMEMLWSRSLDDRTLPKVAVFQGKRHIDAAIATGNGALLTGCHFGNWELMGLALAHLGVPMNVIARRLDDPEVEDVLYGLRSRTGAQVIHKEEAVRTALRVLREGQAVGVLIDQNTLPGQGSFVPFFGRQASTTRISAQLHLRTGAPIIMAFCVPEADHYRFVFEPLETGELLEESDGAVERITALATRRIEDHVRQCPEAWLWIHDRWRTQPEPVPEAGAR